MEEARLPHDSREATRKEGAGAQLLPQEHGLVT